jgi:translation elongation factor EF-1alpha
MPFTAAWVMDKLKRERECGYTVDGNIAQVRTCQGGAFTIFDTPGNPRFAQKAVRTEIAQTQPYNTGTESRSNFE